MMKTCFFFLALTLMLQAPAQANPWKDALRKLVKMCLQIKWGDDAVRAAQTAFRTDVRWKQQVTQWAGYIVDRNALKQAKIADDLPYYDASYFGEAFRRPYHFDNIIEFIRRDSSLPSLSFIRHSQLDILPSQTALLQSEVIFIEYLSHVLKDAQVINPKMWVQTYGVRTDVSSVLVPQSVLVRFKADATYASAVLKFVQESFPNAISKSFKLSQDTEGYFIQFPLLTYSRGCCEMTALFENMMKQLY